MDTKEFIRHQIAQTIKWRGIMTMERKPSVTDLAELCEKYHQAKLKSLGIGSVVGQSEQFYCELTNKDECRQTGVQCRECKDFEDKWK